MRGAPGRVGADNVPGVYGCSMDPPPGTRMAGSRGWEKGRRGRRGRGGSRVESMLRLPLLSPPLKLNKTPTIPTDLQL